MDEEKFERKALQKGERMLKAQQSVDVWTGFGAVGLVGWSVIIPTLLLFFVGRWLHPSGGPGYTVCLLLGGLILGCISAVVLVKKDIISSKGDDNGPE